MRLAILGGTFDPIHSAHLELAREAAKQFRLDRVLFVPAARPPHKTGATYAPYEDRYRMVEIACGPEPLFQPSRLEADRTKSYSIFTIEKVKAGLAPNDAVFFLIGADAFAEIRTWYRWQDVVHAVDFIVASRPGHTYEVPQGARIHSLKTMDLQISSSEIRRRLCRGEFPPEVPPQVLAYIRARGLYLSIFKNL